MKKIIITIVFILAFFYQGQSGRIITSWDIARWFLDSDLVLICHVYDVKTILVRKNDFIDADGFRNKSEIIKENYFFTTDSIIKGEQQIDKVNQAVTPEFASNSSREKTTKIFKELDENNDSVFIFKVEVPQIGDYENNSYFRPSFQEKCIIFLKKLKNDHEIVYQNSYDNDFLAFLKNVKKQGEDFFKPKEIDN